MRLTILRLLPFLIIGLGACKSNDSGNTAETQETTATATQSALADGWYAVTDDSLNAVKLPLYKKEKESYFLEKSPLLSTNHVQTARIHVPPRRVDVEMQEPSALVMKLDSQGVMIWKGVQEDHLNKKIGLVISGRLIQIQVVANVGESKSAVIRRKEISESELRAIQQAIGK